MQNFLQDFLATATIKAATNLETALLRLPEEKRHWKPSQNSRSALDMVAECALMNGNSIDMIAGRNFPADYAYLHFRHEIIELCADWPTLQKLLHHNTAQVADVIRAIPDEQINQPIVMPWGDTPTADIISYPYWNMTYHEGQVNYLASMLGCLD
jgi:hypothetical protein